MYIYVYTFKQHAKLPDSAGFLQTVALASKLAVAPAEAFEFTARLEKRLLEGCEGRLHAIIREYFASVCFACNCMSLLRTSAELSPQMITAHSYVGARKIRGLLSGDPLIRIIAD